MPAGSGGVVNVATPFDKGTVATAVASDLKVTEPDMCAPSAPVTVAVKVTADPAVEGLADETSVVAVGVIAIVGVAITGFVTVCVSAGDIELPLLASPP